MKRSKPLRGKPAKVRDFQRRARKPLNRRALMAGNPRKRRSSSPGATGWTQRVFTLYGSRCLVCGKKAHHGHHVVPRQRIMRADHLTQEERELREYDARQGIPICHTDHAAHELASRRIPRRCLPEAVIEWAYDNGFATTIDDRRLYP